MNILICAAELPNDERVVHFGGLMARVVKADKVTVLHVQPRNAPQAEGESLLAAAAAEMGDLSPDTRLERGAPGRTILRVAQEGGYDLLVLGARHTPDTHERPVGRVARQVATNASVSTLIVKGEPTALERIMVCSGGRPIAEPVIQLGAALAEATEARATLLHVSSAVPGMYTGLPAMEENIEEMMSRDTPESKHLRESMQTFHQRNVEAVLELRHGVAIEEIIRATKLRHYDLIMVGASDAAPRLNRLFFGKVTEQILNYAPASVLVVRATSAD